MLNRGTHRLLIRKDALKFSSAHMTVFPGGTKENLHGHNYQVSIRLDVPKADLSEMIPFHEVKKAAKQICDLWDEKVLLASLCPEMKGRREADGSVQFELCGKKYLLPMDEVVWLEADNVTSESLSKLFAISLAKRLEKILAQASVSRLEVKVEETPGQGASYILSGGAK
ncbi:MAG: 6-carboxytetrahydropterin synthase [Bdellovibrionales bacterium]|nr:6-carboxytetrahydropterin synthase [Bdellovibrionales bacterium]